jgi:protoporphyrinogen oxidase
MSTPSVVVIGGGIAGLAAATRLRDAAPAAAVTLIESTTRYGGKIDGDIVDGCVVDGGADVCIGDKLRATRLWNRLDLATRTQPVNPDHLPTLELRDGTLHHAPSSFDGELLAFRGGMRTLVEVCTDALDHVDTIFGRPATAIQPSGDGRWRVEYGSDSSVTTDAVLIATPASVAADLLSPYLPVAAQLRDLQYPATTTVTMVWDRRDVDHGLQGTGYLVDDRTARVSACTWTSSKHPMHAPHDRCAIRCYIRDRGDHVGPAVAMQMEMATVLGIVKPPLFTRVFRWEAGIPAYTPEHRAAIAAIDKEIRALPGLQIAGSAFHGVGIPDCISSGERAADALVSYLLPGRSEVEAA